MSLDSRGPPRRGDSSPIERLCSSCQVLISKCVCPASTLVQDSLTKQAQDGAHIEAAMLAQNEKRQKKLDALK